MTRQARDRRPIALLEVAPGHAGVALVVDALPDALAGLGPALGIAATGDEGYAVRARAAVLGDGADVDPDVAVLMATSGSTGNPRGVLLTASGLLASAHAAYRRLGGPGAWTLALPVTGVGGLQVLVRSLVTISTATSGSTSAPSPSTAARARTA